jgi:micrococcal nuclease
MGICVSRLGCSARTDPYLRSDLRYLQSITYADTHIYIPPVYFCKVIKVYDGDTITVATKLYATDTAVYRFSVRLAGIDTPEIHGATSAEKAAAITSRDLLSNLIMDKIVLLKNVQFEKYGRLLADVYLGDLHLNQYLLDNNCAVPYDGGKKEKYVVHK